MRLLAVHAHPDDETLFSGALLASWARTGEVELVTCTRGERGEVIGTELAHLEGDGPALAAHRETELAAALASLGVREHAFLDELVGVDELERPVRIEDSGMAWVAEGLAGAAQEIPEGAFVSFDAELAARALARRVAERGAEVLVTYGPDGGYGHPDHVRAHEVTMRAVALLVESGERVPVVLWAVATERHEEVLAAGGPRVEVPLAPVIEEVAGAMRAHATQVQDLVVGEATIDFALSNEVPLRLGPVERFEPAPGAVRPWAWPEGVEGLGWPVP